MINTNRIVIESSKYLSKVAKKLIGKEIQNSSKIPTNFVQRQIFNRTITSKLQNSEIKILRIMSNSKPQVVFVLGGPGAGKGTQCQKIVDEYGFVHLSAGDLLREERSRENSEYGEMIEDCIVNGKIVPVAVTVSLLHNAMLKYMKEKGKKQFLIDGFPRNQDNLDGWNTRMAKEVDLIFVLFFDCSDNVCVTRCLERGKSGSARTDDNEESLKKRIKTYQNDSLPIIDYYKKLNKVRAIDASLMADEVFDKVKEAFKEIKGAGDI